MQYPKNLSISENKKFQFYLSEPFWWKYKMSQQVWTSRFLSTIRIFCFQSSYLGKNESRISVLNSTILK